MPRFRRKTTIVDAIQFRQDLPLDQWPEGLEPDPFGNAHVGPFPVNNGDWVITNDLGDVFPLSAATFTNDYEKVPE